MDLHQIPELGFEEFKTKAYLYEQIKDYHCRIHEVGETGLILYFDHSQKETIAFRADMDALPIQEATDLDFSSKHPGVMHACGHDGHMAILLGLAKYINDHSAEINKNVVLIFQPSEERDAGAHTIVESGLLESYKVKAIFGLHLWPGMVKGNIFSRPNELMAQASEVNVTIKGKSAHVANSNQGIDALKIACGYLTDVYELEEKMTQETYRLLKFGELHSGTVRNIIANEASIYGTLRSFQKEIHQHLKQMLETIADQYEQSHGCQIMIDYADGYDPVLNDEALFNAVKSKIPEIHTLEKPVMQAEDFGVYCQHYPCVFFFLGVGDTAALHHEQFDFDMKVLEAGLQLFINLIKRY